MRCLSETAMRLDTIIVGMDFSPGSMSTATWLADTIAPDARLVLVHAIEPPARPAFPIADTLPAEVLAAAARTEAQERLDEVALAIHRVAVKTEVRIGHAHDVMMDVANEMSADLIALGPHRNYGHTSMLLGTTADMLVRSAGKPVMIGPRSPTVHHTCIVAGITDSSALPGVFAFADYLAKRLAGRLMLVHVLETAAYSHMASVAAAHAHGDEGQERAEVEGELRGQKMHWLRRAAAAGIDSARTDIRVEHGDAGDALLTVARQERAALIVLGGHTAMRHLPAVVGRTVSHVVYGARCGVVVVPA